MSMKLLAEEMLSKDSSQGFKKEQRGFGTDFHSIALLLQFRVGWIVSRLSITTGRVNLDTSRSLELKYLAG